MKSEKLPAMPFYTGDYLKSANVRSCKPDVRGLYVDCLCYLWNTNERGVFIDGNNNPYTEDEVVSIIGLDNQNSTLWLTTLLKKGLLKKRESDGAIYNERMVKDENLRKIRRAAGKQGGNPFLVNQNSTKNEKQDNLTSNQIVETAIEYIIDYLNKKIKSNYKKSTRKTRSLIVARFNEGFVKDDFVSVINKKHTEWGGTDMEKYLRPETLFGTKFESYLNQKETGRSNIPPKHTGKNKPWEDG